MKYENVINMKNKPDPALVGGSYLFNEILSSYEQSKRACKEMSDLLQHFEKALILNKFVLLF
jgi:hypothetical protein